MLYTEDEAFDILEGKEVDIDKIRKRKELFFVFTTDKHEEFYYGADAKRLRKIFMDKLLEGELRGLVTYNPSKKVSGRAKVIMDVNHDTIEKDEVLVTSMTRPEFMPLMRKAKAVITDEGGLTCHAAIVSREMKIPCIISTKNATKKIKTGDMVEFDFDNGKIKIIK